PQRFAVAYQPALCLAAQHTLVQRIQVPACLHFGAERGDGGLVGDVEHEVAQFQRIGCQVVQLVRIGRRVDEFVGAAAQHHDGRHSPFGQVLADDLVVTALPLQVRQQTASSQSGIGG